VFVVGDDDPAAGVEPDARGDARVGILRVKVASRVKGDCGLGIRIADCGGGG